MEYLVQIVRCRLCGNVFFDKPLLSFKNMPKSAQHLPDVDSLNDDVGIVLELFQCSGCGLVQLNSEPVPYYREVIRAAGISPEMFKFRSNQFEKFVEKYNLFNKSIIEIGCGEGEYLSIMQKFVKNSMGVENNSSSVEICIKKELNVFENYIENEEQKLDNAPFDSFFILNFLEHIPNINSFLKGIYNNLKVDSVGLVEVPNFDMMLKKDLFSEFINDHLFYFTKETLAIALDINGFEIIEMKEIWHNYIISATVRKKKKVDLSSFQTHQKTISNEINNFINRFEKDEVAIWGAGHQAFAIISLCDLHKKIKYIVDSAKFKHDKFSPASHIRIVAPEELNRNPVKAIIVMAASYSDEVSRIIREKFDQNIEVRILRDFGLEEK